MASVTVMSGEDSRQDHHQSLQDKGGVDDESESSDATVVIECCASSSSNGTWDANDEELYYEEEIIDTDDDDSKFIMETKTSASNADDEEEDPDLYEEITVLEDEEDEEIVELSVVDDDDDDHATGNDTYMDDSMADSGHNNDAFCDDSSVALASVDSSLNNSEEAKMLRRQMETAITEGARKAMMEQMAREQTLQEVAARRRKQRQLLEQETARLRASTPSKSGGTENASKKGPEGGDTARETLLQEIRRINEAVARNKERSNIYQTPRPPVVGVENKKRALAELRRQAAREELAKSNSALEASLFVTCTNNNSGGFGGVIISSSKNNNITASLQSSPRSVSQHQDIDSSVSVYTPSSTKRSANSLAKLSEMPVPINLDAPSCGDSSHSTGEKDGDPSSQETESLHETSNHAESVNFRAETPNATTTTESSPCSQHPFDAEAKSSELDNASTKSPRTDKDTEKGRADSDNDISMELASPDSNFKVEHQNPNHSKADAESCDEPNGNESSCGEECKVQGPESCHGCKNTKSPRVLPGGGPVALSATTKRHSTRNLIQAFESPNVKSPPSEKSHRAFVKPVASPLSIPSLFATTTATVENLTPRVSEKMGPASPAKPKRPVFAPKKCDAQVPSMFRTAQQAKPLVQTNEAPKASCLSTPVDDADSGYYSLEQLQGGTIDGIDIRKRETYLSPSAFQLHFKMSREEFAKLPKWKRDKAKRSLKLF